MADLRLPLTDAAVATLVMKIDRALFGPRTPRECGHQHPHDSREPCVRVRGHDGKHRYGAIRG